jgi:hypothetical protein
MNDKHDGETQPVALGSELSARLGVKHNFSIIREVLQDMRDMETFESREKDFLNNRPNADDAFRNLHEIEAKLEMVAKVERERCIAALLAVNPMDVSYCDEIHGDGWWDFKVREVLECDA